ncbi:MAG: tail fiber protein [Niveispirillum sp.]|uniref:phage tail protein n=1 Tax=Asticcacaulis sp. TaxID=1872648 RepID=UPI001A20F08D|nr:tail fiber protein [Asticcacaulis sp.]MBJ7413886.1 tail fiber protein [Niveispirillum sp.]
MSTPFIGQICFFPWNWAPYGWLPCNGLLQSIQSYQALYSLIGNVYGGDGKTTFGIPDLRGRVPVGVGAVNGASHVWDLAGVFGADAVALGTNTNYLPNHTHTLSVAAAASTTGVATAGAMLGPVTPNQFFSGPATSTNPTTFSPLALGATYGTGAAHENRQPYLVLNACIAWDGEYPNLDG